MIVNRPGLAGRPISPDGYWLGNGRSPVYARAEAILFEAHHVRRSEPPVTTIPCGRGEQVALFFRPRVLLQELLARIFVLGFTHWDLLAFPGVCIFLRTERKRDYRRE
jgi:hypothetical protein